MNTRTSWLRLALVIGAAIAVLGLAACGGDDSTSSNTPAASTAKASNGAGSSSTSHASATEQATDTGSSNSIADELANIAGDVKQAKGKISYQFSNTTGSDVSSGNYTLYSDPPKSRVDIVDGSDVSIIITTPDASYYCAANQCIKSPGSTDSAGLGLFSLYSNPDQLAGYVQALQGVQVDTSSESIAGVDAQCFSYNGTVEGTTGQGKICFSDQGLMLSVESQEQGGDTFSLKATSYSDSTSDSDFEPPYDVTDLSGIPTG